MPWTGSRARTREVGYWTAMYEIAGLAQALRDGPLHPDDALKALADYAFETFIIGAENSLTPRGLSFWGDWEGRQHRGGAAPVEGSAS
jgi:hypothetical protein